jgi:hypothetical protein
LKTLPKQIFNIEEFKGLSERAVECRVVKEKGKDKDKVKLKLRTKKMLYIFSTTSDESKKILSEIKTKITEY